MTRGSCPRLPANLTRATKPALIDEVQRMAAEMAELHELLRAIDEVILPPRPAAPDLGLDVNTYAQVHLQRQDDFAGLQRDRAVRIQASVQYVLRDAGAPAIAAKGLRKTCQAELPYPAMESAS